MSQCHTFSKIFSTRTERMLMLKLCSFIGKYYTPIYLFISGILYQWNIWFCFTPSQQHSVKKYFSNGDVASCRAEPDLEFEGLLKRQHTRVKYFQGSLMNAMDLERAKVTLGSFWPHHSNTLNFTALILNLCILWKYQTWSNVSNYRGSKKKRLHYLFFFEK